MKQSVPASLTEAIEQGLIEWYTPDTPIEQLNTLHLLLPELHQEDPVDEDIPDEDRNA